MKLYIFRHAIAEDRASFHKKSGLNDDLRPLTQIGIKKFSQMLKHNLDCLKDAEVIFESSLLRSKQTSKQIKKNLNISCKELKELNPNTKTNDLFLKLIKSKYKKIIIVGHEPELGKLIGFLLGSKSIPIKKGGLCIFKIKSYAKTPGQGKLLAFIPPL